MLAAASRLAAAVFFPFFGATAFVLETLEVCQSRTFPRTGAEDEHRRYVKQTAVTEPEA